MILILISTVIMNLLTSNIIQIKDAWVRSGEKGMNTALYLTINNDSDKPDTLYLTASELSEVVEIHESYKKGDMMGMRKIEFVVVPPKSSVSLKPGGLHVMLIKLKTKLAEGSSGEFKLFFKRAGIIKLNAPVRR